MEPNINLRDVKNVRVTCDHATIEGLTLDLNMMGLTGDDKTPAKSSTGRIPNPQLVAKDHSDDGKFHLLLAASGSVATIKIPNIVQGLSTYPNLSIRIILTDSAAKFLQGQSDEQPDLATIAKYPNVDAIYQDEDEWRVPWVRGAPILHIELRRWADLMVIAPLSANTLAKISNGLCDNLLTSVVRAWQVGPSSASSAEERHTESEAAAPEQKRIIIAPAMNTAMWRHPLTGLHLRAPGSDEYFHWFDVLRPVEKMLACGDAGDGAMCDWEIIVQTIGERLASQTRSATSE